MLSKQLPETSKARETKQKKGIIVHGPFLLVMNPIGRKCHAYPVTSPAPRTVQLEDKSRHQSKIGGDGAYAVLSFRPV
jgi:hypothetical protein